MGKVTDKTNNVVLSFTNIYLPEQNRGTLTDENGEFELSGLPRGEFKIQYLYIGYKTLIKVQKRITIKAKNYSSRSSSDLSIFVDLNLSCRFAGFV
jgi:hypothetical protein